MVGNFPILGINIAGMEESIAPKETPFVAYVTSPKIISMFAMVEINGCILNFAIKNPAMDANPVVRITQTISASSARAGTGIPVKSKI